MNLFEALKKTFISDIKKVDKLSNSPDLEISLGNISPDMPGGYMAIDNTNTHNVYDFNSELTQIKYQAQIVESYRVLATDTEVSNGIDIIINELIYTVNSNVFKIDIQEDNDKISDVVNETFKEILDMMDIKYNIFKIARTMYIDGQLNVALSYLPDLKKGIRTIKIVEPIGLYFDSVAKLWKYDDELYTQDSLYKTDVENSTNEFTESELVHIDYDLHTKVRRDQSTPYLVNLGYLENVNANANMLKTLENMLVPMRYSRSVSRRLFNIDIADLPPKQAKELMDKIRAEFRYKKTFDPDTGTIKNIKNTQPLVEDYWMSNRSGSKGTTVDTMDERGSAMDLDDIRHAAKKLYASLKIPEEFNPYSEDPGSFSFDNTEITQSLLKFYIFVSRLRQPLTRLLKEILRRQLVAKGVFQDQEWKTYEKNIDISFTADSTFLENMRKELFMKGIESWSNLKDSVGEIISLEQAVKETFGWSTEQLMDSLNKIQEEKLKAEFKAFYGRDEDQDNDGQWR